MDGIIAMANGSSSSLYGCIGCAVNDMIISAFPKGYFKYTAISSELAVRNIRRTFGSNTNTEIVKRQKPLIWIQPTYSTRDIGDPLQHIPLTSNLDNLQYGVYKQHLFEVIRDKKYGYNLKYRLNRDTIEFDVTVSTDTLHQQLDIYKTILNQLVWEQTTCFRIALESIIPKRLVMIMGKYCNMDIEKEPDYIPILLRRLNKISGYPITYKLRNASGTDEWFMYYTHNVMITFSDLSVESGQKKNMVDDSYNITFKVTASFNMPGVYFLDGDTDKIKGFEFGIAVKETSEEYGYFPIYSVFNLHTMYPPEKDGMTLYGTTVFNSDARPLSVEDRVSMTSILDDDHIRVIRAHRSWNMNPDTLLKVFLLKDGDTQKYMEEYKIDWNAMELVVFKPDCRATYRIIVYFNYGTVNEILNNSTYDRNYDIHQLKKNHFPHRGLEDLEGDEHIIVSDSHGEHGRYDYSQYVDNKTSGELEDNETIVVEDTNYCANDEHEKIDPDMILYKGDIVVQGKDDNIKQLSDDTFLSENIPEDVDPNKGEIYVLEDDPTYCADEHHEEDNIDEDKTNAENHNEHQHPEIKKKKYHSSVK